MCNFVASNIFESQSIELTKMNIPVEVFKIMKRYSKVRVKYGLQVAQARVIGKPKIQVIPNRKVKNMQFRIIRLTFIDVLTLLASNT